MAASSPSPLLKEVLDRIQAAVERSCRNVQKIREMAESKTEPVSALPEVYDANLRIRCYGENCVQELLHKAPQLPDDIMRHLIGNLQSNKVKPLIGPSRPGRIDGSDWA